MQRFNVLRVAHQRRNPQGFHMLREKGQPAINFIHFILPVEVVANGVSSVTNNNACIIYTPGHRQEYKAYNGILLNDFITFEVDDPHFVKRYKLPENEIFYIRNGDEVTRILEFISFAVADKMEPHDDDINTNVTMLFETLSNLCIDSNPGLRRILDTRQRFMALRDEMLKNPGEWSIDTMARRVWLTRSRFSVLYSEFFSISPNADLMNIKLELAKRLLSTSDKSVSSIAEKCGYSSIGYFIRMFSKKEGKTPLQYRKAELRTIGE